MVSPDKIDLKILLVITGLGVGGAERLVTSLADRFAALGHEVLLIRLQGSAELRPLHAEVKMETLGIRRNPISLLVGMLKLGRLIKAFHPDVVNSHLIHANILVRFLRIFLPMRRLISSAHNNNEGGKARMLAYRVTDWLADISTNVSYAAVKAFEEKKAVPRGRMLVVHNGIDTDLFDYEVDVRQQIRNDLDLPEEVSLILAVGRLSAPKDYPNLLQAFSHLCQSESEIKLCIVGDGPLRNEIEDMAVSLGVRSRILFLGVRHDVSALMSACDCFVLSSAWEGFGLVVAEAMACERPVVATDCGGVREVVGDAGFLVCPRDADALAAAIKSVLELPEERKRSLGRSARKRVIERYSFDVTAERYLAIYRTSLL